MELWQEVAEQFACDHDEMEVRRRTVADGRLMLYEQCPECGKVGRCIKKAGYSEERIAALPPFDDEIQKQRFEERRLTYQQAQQEQTAQRQAEWWAWYNNYLRTPAWQAKRTAVLNRAKGVCEGCGIRRPVHVHHLTYDRAGNEMLFDLAAVCLDCHQRLHPDREIGAYQ